MWIRQEVIQSKPIPWPSEYTNADTHKRYQPHHEAEKLFVFSDHPRYALAKGGEGGGKSVAGIIKNLNRLRRGMSGIMVSPDFEHFKRSLWPEFRRWCPWQCVVEKDRYRQNAEWEASKPFQLHFNSEAGTVTTLYCGGIEDPNGWEGPNVSFAHFDEGRRHKTPEALKVLDGRVRILGPQGEPPQLYITTTPRKHWLFEYFGPIDCRCSNCNADFKGQTALSIVEFFKYACPACGSNSLESDDKRLAFKSDSRVVDLLTIDNEMAGNVAAGYTQQRRQSLSEAEARVLLGAEWEDIGDDEKFLQSMILWDANREDLPPLGVHEPLVIAIDAGVSNDSFGMIGITAHPYRPGDYAIRLAHEWKPPQNGKIDFRGSADAPGPDWMIRNVYAPQYALLEVVYDPYQLESFCADLMRDGVIQCVPFSQQKDRLEADKFLYDAIIARRLAHDGNDALRKHIDNANRKVDLESRKLRIVKREEPLKIDLAVCASMCLMSAYRLGIANA